MMNKNAVSTIDNTILMQAADWFSILQSGDVSKDEEDLWLEWLTANTLHQQAWVQVEQVSGSFQKLKNRPDSYAARKLLTQKEHKQSSTSIIQNLFIFCLLCIVGGFGWFQFTPQQIIYSEKNFQSAIGETQTITLSDGTIVVLNTNTQIRTIYSEKLRRIVLTSGEIMVSSAPDNIQPARPLVVDTDNGRLTPIGTRFNVRHIDQTTELNVFEGAVKIQPNHTNSMAIVTSGRQGRFDKQQIFDSNLEADNSRQSWTRGILLADNLPLCEFVSELNRYRQSTIICSPDISHFKLVGAYPLTDTEQILDAVESSLPIRFWQVNEKIWRVDMRR